MRSGRRADGAAPRPAPSAGGDVRQQRLVVLEHGVVERLAVGVVAARSRSRSAAEIAAEREFGHEITHPSTSTAPSTGRTSPHATQMRSIRLFWLVSGR